MKRFLLRTPAQSISPMPASAPDSARRRLLQTIAVAPGLGLVACVERRSGKAIAPAPALPLRAARSVVTLAAADGREVAVTEWTPAREMVGTILFSHGAGSAPDLYPGMIDAWAAAGWRVLAPLHVDSRQYARRADYPGLASWRARIEDMRLLSAHIGDTPYVAAGHSYGGLVALTLGGARAIPPEGAAVPLSDPKVRAVIAFSPPAPIPVLVTAQGYSGLGVPALIQTGTADVPPGKADAEAWRGHLAAFEAAPAGNHRYGLVLAGVDHYFGGAICDFDRPGPAQRDQLEIAVALSMLFLAAFGLGNAAAQARLDARVTPEPPVMLLKK